MRQPQLRIGFVPYNHGENEYCARMCEILGRVGAVQSLPRFTISGLVAALQRPERVDVAFVSWYENQLIDSTGRVRALRVAKVLLKTLALRAHAKKLVFIRHNHVPHATAPRDRPLVQRLIDVYEAWLFDRSLVHSAAEAAGSRGYCPHPLYHLETARETPAQPLPAAGPGRFFVVFGRIEPYKQLEELMRVFPDNTRLVICGRSSDDAYLTRLTRLAPEHVTILHGFIPDAAAQELIRRSSGVVISHASDDMIVSASFFYAMTLGQRVYAVETPFLRWASELLGSDIVVVSPNLGALCRRLASAQPCAASQPTRDALIEQHFGDDAIARHLAVLLERLGLDVRFLESSCGAIAAAVCCSQRGDGAVR